MSHEITDRLWESVRGDIFPVKNWSMAVQKYFQKQAKTLYFRNSRMSANDLTYIMQFYYQGNRQVEGCVKFVKRTMNKCYDGNADIYVSQLHK